MFNGRQWSQLDGGAPLEPTLLHGLNCNYGGNFANVRVVDSVAANALIAPFQPQSEGPFALGNTVVVPPGTLQTDPAV